MSNRAAGGCGAGGAQRVIVNVSLRTGPPVVTFFHVNFVGVTVNWLSLDILLKRAQCHKQLQVITGKQIAQMRFIQELGI